MKIGKMLSIIFLISLIGCVSIPPAPTVAPIPTATLLPSPTLSPTPVPQIDSIVKSNTVLFPCSNQNTFTPIPLKEGTSIVLKGRFKEMGIISEYEGQTTACAMIPLQYLDVQVNALPELLASEFVVAEYGSALEEINSENAKYMGEVASLGTGIIQDIAYSPDGQYLVVTTPYEIHFYNGDSFEFVRVIETPSSFFDFSPDGMFVYTASNLPEKNKSIKIWNISDGSFENEIHLKEGRIRSLSVSPDGSYFLTAGNRGVLLWDVEDGKGVKTITGVSNVSYAKFSFNGDFIAVGAPGTIEIYGSNGTLKWQKDIEHAIPYYEGEITPKELMFSPDDKFINVVGETVYGRIPENAYQIMDGETTKDWRKFHAYSASNRFFASNGSWGVYISIKDSKADDLFMITGPQGEDNNPSWGVPGSGRLIDVVFSPNEKYFIFASSDGSVQVWDLETRTLKTTLTGFSVSVLDLDVTRDGSTIIFSTTVLGENENDGRYIFLWKPWDNTTTLLPDNLYGRVHDVKFIKNDSLIATSGPPTQWSWTRIETHIWSIEPAEILETYIRSGYQGGDISIDDEGTALATYVGAEADNVYLWRMGRTKNPIAQFHTIDRTSRRDIAVSPNGAILAFEGYKDRNFVLVLHDILNNKEIDPIAFPWEGSFAFTSDSSKIVMVGPGEVHFWDTNTWTKTGQYNGNFNLREDSRIAISTDGLLMALITGANEIKLYDIENGATLLTTLSGHTNQINEIAFSKDGRFIVSGSDDGTIKLWGVKP